MKKLTANIVQQRVKSCTTDLDKVLQINVTGRELEDISLLKTMTGVEILSLSVNNISRLSDLQFCKNLTELYLRHNNISELSEIFYLKNLPKLRLLVLSDNPCCEDPSYRMTVIRNLKHLTDLDGVAVTLEERRQAQKSGVEFKTATSKNDVPDDSNESSNQTKKTSEPLKELSRAGHTKPVEQEDPSLGQSPHKTAKELSHFTTESTEPAEWNHRNSNKHPEQKNMLNSKRTNILSAILSLIKELDYSGLQVVDAEICSMFNAFDADILCQEKKFLPKKNTRDTQ